MCHSQDATQGDLVSALLLESPTIQSGTDLICATARLCARQKSVMIAGMTCPKFHGANAKTIWEGATAIAKTNKQEPTCSCFLIYAVP